MKGASGLRLGHAFAGVEERDSSIRCRVRERSSTSFGPTSGDEGRPSKPQAFPRDSSRGVRSTLHGETRRSNAGGTTIGKDSMPRLSKERRFLEREIGRELAPPSNKGYLRRAKPRDEGRIAKAKRFSRVASIARPFTWSGRALRGEVEGDARSGGVPKNSVECKKPREQGQEPPGKGAPAPRARIDGLRATRSLPRDLGVEVARKR